MRLGVDITVIAKLLQLEYATIILYCKQTSIKTNLLHIALENERLIFAWLWPYLYTKERKSLHYWTTPILSCAHLSTTYYTPTLFNYYLTVFLLSPCYKLWFQDSWLVFEFSPLLLLPTCYYFWVASTVFDFTILSTIIDSSCLKNYHTTTSPPCACLAKKSCHQNTQTLLHQSISLL